MKIKYYYIKLILLQLLTFLGCSNSENIQIDKIGAIYGKIEIYPSVIFKAVKITLDKNKNILNPDSNGIFYFGAVKAGRHYLNISIPGLGNYISKEFDVGVDSLTILGFGQINYSKSKILDYDCFKVLKYDTVKYGSISGYVYEPNDPKPIQDGYVHLSNTFWSSRTDSSGFYKIDNVIIGKYDLFAVNKQRTIYEELKIEIYPDSNVTLNVTLKYYEFYQKQPSLDDLKDIIKKQ